MVALTSGTVIDRITRVGDIGEPGYSAYGQRLPECTGSGSQDDWHGATQDNLSALLPTCYITESVYSYLTDGEIESVRGRIRGIVPNSYAHKYYKGRDRFGKQIYCWAFKPGTEARPLPPLDPCEGVVCEDVCINADKYSQTCVSEGENAGECTFDQLIKANSPDCPGYDPCEGVVCEDVCDGTDLYESVCEGGACVRGRLIEPSSVECGYVPHVCNEGELRSPTTCEDGSVIYGEMCSNNAWVPTGYTCEDAPAPKPDKDWITYLFIGVGIIMLYQILRVV